MILSDRSIREALASGRIGITPLDEANIQPSSVDLRLGRFFRVFLNHTTRVIDVKEDQEDLTPLVEIQDDDVFILHPGEFVLGSTAERVSLPDDLVARLEGKSSLGRLGLLIHSSLPASERVLFLDGDGLRPRRIGDIVDKRLAGSVVGFDPETLSVGYHEVTGWFEGPADRIFEVLLASGRSVRVTAGHNLFTLDRDGEIRHVRTGELRPGTMVALAGAIPEPPAPRTGLNVLDFAPESSHAELTVAGPAVTAAFATRGIEVQGALRDCGLHHVAYYRSRSRLPVPVARQIPGLLQTLGPSDVLSCRGSRHGMPAVVDIDEELAWLLGLYVAEGSRRRNQVVVSNTDQSILDRTQRVFARLGVPVYRSGGAVTAMSGVLSQFVDWIDAGPSARKKQVPPLVFGWPAVLLESFIEGFVDGDGSREATRTSLWSSSPQLVDDLLYLTTRLGRRASASLRLRCGRPLYQVSVPKREHKLLTTVPLPDRLLLDLRRRAGLNQLEASRALAYRHATDLNNIERRYGRDAVRQSTLRRFQRLYASLCASVQVDTSRLNRLIDGGVLWDRVVAVEDTGAVEPVYDLEVRPSGRRIENFLAGVGGVFVSNTAGFVDCGFQGHLTLELSNVANLPITLYPGMKIGQISFLRMTTPADRPYGSKEAGSKYQGQQGPTPSRYFENFQ